MEQVDVNNQLKTYMGDVLMNVMSSNPQILEKNNKEKWKLDVLFKWILLNWEYIRRFIYKFNGISYWILHYILP